MMVFWGLVLEPSKRYTQKVQQSFHISQAALELCDGDSEPIQLILEYDGSNYVLGTLSRKASLFQVPLDLNFNTGDQISFRTIGRGRVHLTGYHLSEDDLDEIRVAEANRLNEDRLRAILASALMEKGKRKKSLSGKSKKTKKRKMSSNLAPEPSDDDSMDEEASEESYGDLLGTDDDDDTDDFEDEDMETDEDDIDDDDSDSEETARKGKKTMSASSKKAGARVNGKAPKKMKASSPAKPSPKSTKKVASPSAKGTKESKTPRTEKKSPKGEKKDQNKQDLSPQKKVVEGGVIIEEIKVGEGQVAKPGKMVQVYYVGKLQSNKKQFDATTQGPGFKFKLGKGEVIRGWDIGVNGMKVGGKRKITIPAQLGYGAKGAPPAIPPNSVLIFEVELKAVN